MSDTAVKKKIDPETQEFKDELKKTVEFTDKVVNQFGFVYNPDMEINESIQFGLTRNKLIYGKRFCPCFFVTGNKEEDRICPCKPAISHEIPDEGHCHCGIFCTSEYAKSQASIVELEVAVSTHSRGLTKEECELLLTKHDVDSDELEALLEARDLGMVNFVLADVREWMENKSFRIKGTDELIPTTSFYEDLKKIENKKDLPVIVYCHVGSRSAYCQSMMATLGFKRVINLMHGISWYKGDILKG
jgi:ferredoxin-thioredoxin reductase catalytic subunit/rhodanese-related sulfurtransferase